MTLQGTVGASVAINRKKGFADGISGYANLFIGREPVSFGLVSHRKMHARAQQILAQYGLAIDVSQPLANYSIAIQQIAATARAVDLSARVLILDEPTRRAHRQPGRE